MRLVHRAPGKRSTGFHESPALRTFMKRVLPALPILAVLAAILLPAAPAESSGNRENAGFPYMPPNDPYYAPTNPTYGFGQWNLKKYTYVKKKNPRDNLVLDSGICASMAWRITTGSEDVVVCIMDSGIDVYNADLANNLGNLTRRVETIGEKAGYTPKEHGDLAAPDGSHLERGRV